MKTIYFAGGCFWGVQKFFDQFDGVTETEVGYANGPEERDEKIYGTLTEEQKHFASIPPGYQEVCNNIGFAETVKVVYDKQQLPTEKLLRYFFEIIDPTAVNRQGPDIGVQYRSGIYYEDDSLLPVIQKVADEVEQRLQRAKGEDPRATGHLLATEVAPLANYFTAEEYHQKYLDKIPNGYCHIPQSKFLLQYAENKRQGEDA